MFPKKSKRYVSKLKWVLKLTWLKLKDSQFRRLVFELKIKDHDLQKYIEIIKSLLRLHPAWIKGHYLIAIIAYKKFQLTKENQLKGIIRLSNLALDKLNGPEDHRLFIEGINNFCQKKYMDASKILEQLVNNKNNPKNASNLIILELLGSCYLLQDKKDLARDTFLKIPKKSRSMEIEGMIGLLNCP